MRRLHLVSETGQVESLIVYKTFAGTLTALTVHILLKTVCWKMSLNNKQSYTHQILVLIHL